MIDAYHATLTSSIGISSRELAEIGGFSDRFARDLMSGKRSFPPDVREAVEDIADDIDVMTDSLCAQIEDGERLIFVFGTNKTLREHFPEWPGRGKASGGFTGPHQIAAITAADLMRERGVLVEMAFFESIHQGPLS